MSALHWAASLSLVEIVELLLNQEDINVNILDLKNQTPLENAIVNNNIRIVKIFTDKISLQYKFRDYLMSSIQNSNTDIFKFIFLFS